MTYNAVKETLDGTPLKPVNGRIKLEILLDRCTLETFANEGRLYMPNFLWDLPAADRSLQIFVSEGSAKAIALEVLCRSAELPSLCSDRLPCYLERRRGLLSSSE